MESIISDTETVLCDMPEILNRWQIGANHSLDELIDIFNAVMDKLQSGRGPLNAGTCALYYFPEVFQRRRDEYIFAMLKKIVSEEPAPDEQGETPPTIKTIDVYLGNMHVSPITRLWNTQTISAGKEPTRKEEREDGDSGRGRKVAKKAPTKKAQRSIEFETIH